MLGPISPPPFLDRRPLMRRRFRFKCEASLNTSLVRLGSHVISHPNARSGPVNTMGPYLVHLPQITIGLQPKKKRTFTKPEQVAASIRMWTGDYHPAVLRELSDVIPIEMLTARQRTKTTAVVAAATALIFAYQGKEVPVKVDTPVLKDLITYLERYIPKRFLDGRQGTRMEMFLSGVRRFLLHLSPKTVIYLDDEDDLEQAQDFKTPFIKIEDTETMPPQRHTYMDDFEQPSAPPRSRKRVLDDAEERPTKRARPGHGLSPRHDILLLNQYHPSTETAGMKQLLELAGLGAGDVDQCLRFMAQGMSAKRAMAELRKPLELPA